MGVNLGYAGREYPANDPYEVGREKIRDFADAVGAAHGAHRDVGVARSLGHPDVIAPPTFAVVVAQRAEQQLIADPEAGSSSRPRGHADGPFPTHGRTKRPPTDI